MTYEKQTGKRGKLSDDVGKWREIATREAEFIGEYEKIPEKSLDPTVND